MTVRTQREGPVTLVIIDRPERRNAVDGPAAAALTDAFAAFDRDGQARVAVLTGTGGTFCAGSDLKAMAAGEFPIPTADGPPPLGPTRMRLAKPVIAAIEGGAFGGGLELALWCDLRVAAEDAELGLLNLPKGMPCLDGGSVRLSRLIGHGRAAPANFGAAPLLRVHDQHYVEFLEQAWNDWAATGNRGEAIPDCWPARRMTQRRPNSITGKLGYYAMAGETSISQGTWEAARAAADVALTGAVQIQEGARAAFALCRPPGHHAARDLYGGYCFLNNAAIAAQSLRDAGAARVAILDVDFHHGNGTQDIFYDRADVLYVSLHGDPADAFPYFSGYADETGTGAGHGFNMNFPMGPGTQFDAWQRALRAALKAIADFRADALIVSLGVDTFAQDPISFFRLQSEDFSTYGRMIGACALPTLFVLEGGYAVGEIGINVVNVLSGFEEAQA